MTKEEAARIKQRLEEAKALQASFDMPSFRKWKQKTELTLENAFGQQNKHMLAIARLDSIGVFHRGDDLEQLKLSKAVQNLPKAIELLESLIEIFEESEPTETKSVTDTGLELHPLVEATARPALNSKSYRNAVHDSFIAIIDELKKKLKYPKLPNGREMDGDALVRNAFGGNSPILYFVAKPTAADADFQTGVLYLWLSAVYFRNEKAHKLTEIKDKQIATSYLHIASLAMTHLDNAKIRKQPKKQVEEKEKVQKPISSASQPQQAELNSLQKSIVNELMKSSDKLIVPLRTMQGPVFVNLGSLDRTNDPHEIEAEIAELVELGYLRLDYNKKGSPIYRPGKKAFSFIKNHN